MDWFWWVLGGFLILGLFAKSSEEDTKKAEEKNRKDRAEAARAAIIASGDQEAIKQLYLIEATYQQPTAGNRAPLVTPSSNVLGTAAAVAGGMVVGNAISSSFQAAQLEAALADIQADLHATSASLGELGDLQGTDIDLEI